MTNGNCLNVSPLFHRPQVWQDQPLRVQRQPDPAEVATLTTPDMLSSLGSQSWMKNRVPFYCIFLSLSAFFFNLKSGLCNATYKLKSKCFQTFQGRKNVQSPAFVMPHIKQRFLDVSRPKIRPKSGLFDAKYKANVFRHFKAEKCPKSGLFNATYKTKVF